MSAVQLVIMVSGTLPLVMYMSIQVEEQISASSSIQWSHETLGDPVLIIFWDTSASICRYNPLRLAATGSMAQSIWRDNQTCKVYVLTCPGIVLLNRQISWAVVHHHDGITGTRSCELHPFVSLGAP